MIVAGSIALAIFAIAFIIIIRRRRIIKNDIAGQAVILAVTADPDGWRRVMVTEYRHKEIGLFTFDLEDCGLFASNFRLNDIPVSNICGKKALCLLKRHQKMKGRARHQLEAREAMNNAIKLAKNKLGAINGSNN